MVRPTERRSDQEFREHHQKKDIRHIRKAVLFTLGPSQLLGAIAATTLLVKSVWNIAMAGAHVGKLAARGSELLATRAITSLTGKNIYSSKDREKALEAFISLDAEKLKSYILTCKDNGIKFVSCLLSTIPLVGVLGAGAFLALIGETKKAHGPTSIQKTASAYSKHVLASLPMVKGGVKLAMYPLRGTSIKSYWQEMTSNYNSMFKNQPERRVSIKTFKELYDRRLIQLGSKPLKIEVDRGDRKNHTIHCDYINTNSDEKAKTMLLFHGNGCIGNSMSEEAELYKENGWNVVIMTYGGYPGSDEGVATTEATTIQDVHALIRHVESLGVEQIGVHGFSMGGSVAMHATQLSDKVCFAALAMTYDSAQGAAANLIKNMKQDYSALSLIPSAISRGIAQAAMPSGIKVHGVSDKNGNAYYTDGCNTLAKVQTFKGVLVSLGANQDLLMGKKRRDDNTYADNFAKDFYNAAEEAKAKFVRIVPAGHEPAIPDTAPTIRKGLRSI